MQGAIIPRLDKIIRLSSFRGRNTSIKLEDGNLSFDGTTISLSEIREVKAAIEPIELDMYVIGSKYCIVLRSETNSLEITFRCFFSIHKKYFNALFNEIINSFWDATVGRLLDESIEVLKRGDTFSIGKCTVSRTGVSFNSNFILWDDLSYQRNYNKLTLNSKSSKEVWTNLFYNEEFNVYLLLGLLEWIYKEGGLSELSSFA